MSNNETSDLQQAALQEIDSIPRNQEEPVFREPWEAEVFAMAIRLHQRGLFSWNEWSIALGQTIKQAQELGDADHGDTYYTHWLVTLERMVMDKKIGDQNNLNQLYAAWNEAAQSTPHGKPIEID